MHPWAAKPHRRPAGYLTHRMLPASWIGDERAWVSGNSRPRRAPRPLRVWLNPEHGPALLRLPVELVWATTWEHEANEWIGPHLGLPKLPVVAWPQPRQAGPAGTFWKSATLSRYAAGRPFVWLDDEITSEDQQWLAARQETPVLAHWVDPRLGPAPGRLRDRGRVGEPAGHSPIAPSPTGCRPQDGALAGTCCLPCCQAVRVAVAS